MNMMRSDGVFIVIIKVMLVTVLLFSCQTHTCSTEIGRAHHIDNTPVCALCWVEVRLSALYQLSLSHSIQ